MTEKDLLIQELKNENEKLKRREEPMQVIGISQDGSFGHFVCPACNRMIGVAVNYCKHCGQRVGY